MSATALYGALVVYVVIAGLELADRTNFSLIALAARNSPLATFVGGALAFIASTGVAVSIGAALVAALGPSRIDLLRIAGGAFLIAYAVWLLFRPVDEPVAPRFGRSALITAFLLTFLLELGDTTMIFQIVFVSTYGWEIVLAAGAAGLITTAAVGTTIGRHLGLRVPPAQLQKLVVAVLLVVGALTVLYGIDPGLFSGIG